MAEFCAEVAIELVKHIGFIYHFLPFLDALTLCAAHTRAAAAFHALSKVNIAKQLSATIALIGRTQEEPRWDRRGNRNGALDKQLDYSMACTIDMEVLQLERRRWQVA